MAALNSWDLVLLVVVGYVAVMALVRLMRRRRDELMGRFRQEFRQEQAHKAKQRAIEQRAKELAARRSEVA